MKIAFFEVKDWEKNVLQKAFSKDSLKFYSNPLKEENIKDITDCEVLSVFIYSKIDSKIIDSLPKLKLIATRSTGFDHIDIDACRKRGIAVSNVPFYGENTVAEHTFALILALSRNVHKFYLRTLGNDFSIEGLKGFDLKDKTLGVIGTGHIGAHVIRIAKGFEMNILAFDKYKNSKLAKQLGFSYVSLNELLKKSDIITLHAPATKETFHLINEKNIGLLKPSALIINTSRGDLINTKALLSALNKRKIAGAGLDVIEGETLIKEEKELLHKVDNKKMRQLIQDHAIIRDERIVFTPHIAFYSQEALERILNTTLNNIKAYMDKKLVNLV